MYIIFCRNQTISVGTEVLNIQLRLGKRGGGDKEEDKEGGLIVLTFFRDAGQSTVEAWPAGQKEIANQLSRRVEQRKDL